MLPSPSAQRVKKRPNQVIALYNASTMLRFQSGGSVLHHITKINSVPVLTRASTANQHRTVTVRPTRSNCCGAFFAVRQNLTSEWLSELMIGKFGLALL